MGRDKRFHNLIEQENAEEKTRVWARIKSEDGSRIEKKESAFISGTAALKKIWLLCSSFVIVIVALTTCIFTGAFSQSNTAKGLGANGYIYLSGNEANGEWHSTTIYQDSETGNVSCIYEGAIAEREIVLTVAQANTIKPIEYKNLSREFKTEQIIVKWDINEKNGTNAFFTLNAKDYFVHIISATEEAIVCTVISELIGLLI